MPVCFRPAYTAPVNPPHATPVLTHAQVWQGLQRKVRYATEFVPLITSCEILSDDGNVVTRDVEGHRYGPGQKVRHICKSYAPSRVDFHQADGALVATNIISAGPSGAAEDLFLTYFFELSYPDMTEGSLEAKTEEEKHAKTGQISVDSTLETIRKLVREGIIE